MRSDWSKLDFECISDRPIDEAVVTKVSEWVLEANAFGDSTWEETTSSFAKKECFFCPFSDTRTDFGGNVVESFVALIDFTGKFSRGVDVISNWENSDLLEIVDVRDNLDSVKLVVVDDSIGKRFFRKIGEKCKSFRFTFEGKIVSVDLCVDEITGTTSVRDFFTIGLFEEELMTFL